MERVTEGMIQRIRYLSKSITSNTGNYSYQSEAALYTKGVTASRLVRSSGEICNQSWRWLVRVRGRWNGRRLEMLVVVRLLCLRVRLGGS